MSKTKILVATTSLIAFLLLTTLDVSAQRQMEKLGRGVVAHRNTNNTVYVGWRMLGTDSEDIAFDLYRTSGGNPPVKISANQTQSTNFVDTPPNFAVANSYHVVPVVGGVEGAPSSPFTVQANARAGEDILIPYQLEPGDAIPGSAMINVGDFTGDGEYEYLIRWTGDPHYHDPGSTPSPATDTYKMDAYKLDGTKMWRIDLGWNIITGTDYAPMMTYDLDGDGICEVIAKTAEGTTDGTGITVGDTDNDGRTDYRQFGSQYSAEGDVQEGPEFLSVFSGANGKLLKSVPWIARGNVAQWGGPGRANRPNIAIAYLDGVTPSIVMMRGIYGLMKMEAWNFRGGEMTQVWSWSGGDNPAFREKGSHMARSGDTNGDGLDDILRGGMTMGPNGIPLYSLTEGHADEFHFGDLDPSRPGLEVFVGYEMPSGRGQVLHDAASGAYLWTKPTSSDCGANQTMPLYEGRKGYQFWSHRGGLVDGIFDNHGKLLTSSLPSASFRHQAWWDGDLLREFVDNSDVIKYNPVTRTNTYLRNDGEIGYGGAADCLGDWREEILTCSPEGIRIFSTKKVATNRFYTFMHDPNYRLGVAAMNQRKVPVSTPGFYFGPGMNTPPPAPFSDAKVIWSGSITNNWNTSTTANWKFNSYWAIDGVPAGPATFSAGDSVLFDLTGGGGVVNIGSTVVPASVTLNSPLDYEFTGSGSIGGTGRLTKGGRGVLTISNNNSFSGRTLVGEGGLRVNGQLSQSAVEVRGAGPWGVTRLEGSGHLGNGVIVRDGGGLSPGNGSGAAGTLTVANGLTLGEGSSSEFDLSNNPTGTGNDKIAVTGDLTLAGLSTITINPLNGNLSAGTYKLITYTGALTGSLANLELGGIPTGCASLVQSAGEISLVVTAPRASTASLTWVGGSNGNWDCGLTPNWNHGGTGDVFLWGDSVRFDQAGAARPSVNLVEKMQPANVIVDSATSYTFDGTGGITGPASLSKSNTGTLSLLLDSDYTGPTVVSGGVLEVDNLAIAGKASSIGAASNSSSNLVLHGGSTLRLVGNHSVSTNRGATLTGGVCTVEVQRESSYLTMFSEITGNGVLRKTGPGTLVLTGTNTHSGGTWIGGGVLWLESQSSLGSSQAGLIFSNGGTLSIQNDLSLGTRPVQLQEGGGKVLLTVASSTVGGTISGIGKLEIAARGTGSLLTVSGTNTYTGGTRITTVVWMTKPTSLGTGLVEIMRGGELVFRPGASTLSNPVNAAAAVPPDDSASEGILRLSGTSLTLNGALSLADDLRVTCDNTANLNFTASQGISLGSRTLDLRPANQSSLSATWSLNGPITGTGNLIWSCASPAASLSLRAANTYSGDTTVSRAGHLIFRHPLAMQFSTLRLSSGFVRFASAYTEYSLGGLAGTEDISLANTTPAAITLTVGANNRDTSYSGNLSGSGELVKVGTGKLTLTGTNTYAGATQVNNGTLAFAGSLTSSSAMNVGGNASVVLSGATVTVSSITIAAGGTLSGSGTVFGPVTNDGTVVVPAGVILIFKGAVVNNGTFDTRSGGSIQFDSTFVNNGTFLLPVPPAPTGLNAIPGNGTVSLTWEATQNAVTYQVKRSTSMAGPFALVQSGITGLGFTDQGLTNWVTMYYVVSATNADNAEGPDSDVVSVVPANPPVAGTFTNTTAGNWNSVTWLPNPPGKPVSNSGTTLIFNNGSSIASTNNMGLMVMNRLSFNNQAVQLGGNQLGFAGSSPTIASTPNQAYTIANPLTLFEDTFVNTAAGSISISGVVSGEKSLEKIGGGTLALMAANTYSGGTIISKGTLTAISNARLGAATGGLILRNGATLNLGSGNFTLSRPIHLQAGGGVLSNTSTSMVVSSLISGPGGLTKSGSGTLSLTSPNTHTGGVTVSGGGVLGLDALDTLGTGPVTVESGSQLRIRPGAKGDTKPISNPITLAGTRGSGISSGAINLNGSSLILTGVLALEANSAIGTANNSDTNFEARGPIELNGHRLTLGAGNTTTSQTWEISGVIRGEGGITYESANSSSALVLRGTNTFTGETAMTSGAGELVIANRLALQASTLNFNSGAVRFGNSMTSGVTLGGLKGSRNLSLMTAQYQPIPLSVGNNNESTTYNGVLSQTGSLKKIGNGTLTLTGSHTYTGGTTVSGGILITTGNWTHSGDIVVQSGATLSLADGSILTIDGELANDGTIIVPTGATLILNGAVINNGTLDATAGGEGGSVQINSTFENNGTYLPVAGTSANPVATPGEALVSLSWDAAPNALTYQVMRATTSGGPYATVATGLSETAYQDVSAANWITYYYVVVAMNHGGQGAPSVEVNATPPFAQVEGVYTNVSLGSWSAVTWDPNPPGQPAQGILSKLVFNNGATISSANDLGTFALNELKIANKGLNSTGNSLLFVGAAPSLRTTTDSSSTIANAIELRQDTVVHVPFNTLTLTGAITGDGGISKTGWGTLTLNGVNTSMSGTNIDTGKLRLGGSDKSLGNGPVNVSNGAQLWLNRTGVAVQISDLTVAGAGPSSLGAVYLNGCSATASTLTLSAAAKIRATNTSGLNFSVSGQVDLGSFTLTLTPGMSASSGTQSWALNGGIIGSGGLVLDAAPTHASAFNILTLAGSNSYTGVTRINGGILSVGSIRDGGVPGNLGSASSAASNLVFNGGTLRYTGPSASTERNFTINPGKIAVIDVATGNLTLSGASPATGGGLTKAGNGILTLSGINIHQGATSVSEGTLVISGALRNSVVVTVANGATLQVAGGSMEVGSVSIAGNGIMAGMGTIDGTVTNYGTIRVPAGSVLTFKGAVTNHGTIDTTEGGIVRFEAGFTNHGSYLAPELPAPRLTADIGLVGLTGAGVAVAMSETEPAEAAALSLDKLPPRRSQNNTIISIVQRWGQRASEESAEWVASFPEGPFRKAAADNLKMMGAGTDSVQAE